MVCVCERECVCVVLCCVGGCGVWCVCVRESVCVLCCCVWCV